MIRVTCPHCGSKLNAKDELAGQDAEVPQVCPAGPDRGRRPGRCRRRRRAANTPSDQQVQVDNGGSPAGARLARAAHGGDSHYLICNRTQLVATWENNGARLDAQGGAGFRQREAEPRESSHPRRLQARRIEVRRHARGQTSGRSASYQSAMRWA